MSSVAPHNLFKSATFRHGVLNDNDRTSAEKDNNKDAHGNVVRHSFFSIAQASAPPLPPMPQAMKGWRTYPKVPFYAAIQGLQLVINVAGPEDDAGGLDDNLNDAKLLNNLSTLQVRLQDAVSKYGSIYYMSALRATRNTLLYPASTTKLLNTTTVAPTASTAELDYWKYLQALHDIFHRFTELRDLCCSMSPEEHCIHHVFFLRITDHPRLKDIMALLAIENGRLCFCLCASSRVTQQYFTHRAHDVGVELEWVLGSTWVMEPEELSMTDVNPVFALWDVLVNLPLHATSVTHEMNDVAPFSPDVVIGEHFLRNVNLTLLSSVRFYGSEWCTPALRLCEVGRLPEHGRSRLVWSLVATPCVVLPHLVAGLVRCLVEESPVSCFEMRFAHDSATPSGIEGREDVGHGVAYMTGARRAVVQRKNASSSSSNNFRAFSRLSAEAWLTDDDRRFYGLFSEGDPVPLECEFTVESLRYYRQEGQTQPTAEGEMLQPQCWGLCFRVENHVEHILDENEE